LADPLDTAVLLFQGESPEVAERFAAAEQTDEDAPATVGLWLRRLSWYGFGIGLIFLVYRLHPQPISVLRLQMGTDREAALLAGMALAALGILAALVLVYLRYGGMPLAPPRRYPAGVLNSVATAFIDEAAFRGIALGLLIAFGVPVQAAIAGQALLYGVVTRVAARDKALSMLVLNLAIGFVAGWVTVQTGGIGAAFLGHAVTRLALFAASGHSGQVRSPADEQPLPDARDLTPDGWEIVSDRGPGINSNNQ
jgi:hypothetical protein